MSDSFLFEGITGFYTAQGAPPWPLDGKNILKDCHWVAREAGYQVGEHNWLCMARNFHWVRFTRGEEEVFVLFNAHSRFIAFCRESPEKNLDFSFIASPALEEAFSRVTAFEAVPLSELERPPTPEDLALLSEAEREQVRYWRPKRIGLIIFNHWD